MRTLESFVGPLLALSIIAMIGGSATAASPKTDAAKIANAMSAAPATAKVIRFAADERGTSRRFEWITEMYSPADDERCVPPAGAHGRGNSRENQRTTFGGMQGRDICHPRGTFRRREFLFP